MGRKSPKISDRKYLLTEQYHNASNLSARIGLHDRFSANKYGWFRWIFDQINVPSKSRILELGCGTGTLWLENIDRIPHEWDITLSDLSLGMLREAQQNLCDSQRRFRFGAVDAQAVPFGNGSCDVVIANHVLYHVADRTKTFSEIHRVLRPGGLLYASTVGRTHLQELYELVSRFDPSADPWGGCPCESFLLENGLEQISKWFSEATLRRYKDALVITEAEPLVAYVLSTAVKSSFVGDKLTEFVDLVERELALCGAIRITKDCGIFEARRDGGD